MVVQKPLSEESEERKNAYVQLCEMVRKRCSSHAVNSNGRSGIINFGGGARDFFPHQVWAACHVACTKERDFYARKTSKLLLHDLGTGKTMAVVCLLGLLHADVPRLQDFSVLVICPLSMVSVWEETLKTWTTLGSALAVVHKQSELTEEVLNTKSVIITTQHVLVEAYKSFMELPKGFTKLAHWEQKTDKEGKKVAIHPFFAHLQTSRDTPASKESDASTPAFCAMVVDELHSCCSQTSLAGQIVTKTARECSIKVGLTGTPVGARPSQVADLCCALDVTDEELKQRRSWTDSGGRNLNRATVRRFHQLVVDRVRLDHISGMVQLAEVELQFDPFIGRRPDGTFDETQMAVHDSYLVEAQKQASMGEGQRSLASAAITSAFATMVQCAFCPVLGSVGCKEYNRKRSGAHKLSLKQPSQAQRLLWRVIRDRQQNGHGRIVVFSESTTMLRIARKACQKWKGCGKLMLFTSELKSSDQRTALVKRFLSADNPRSVLFVSQAGATGITLCPGADTLIVFGDLPWNWSALHQVIGRLHRCSQDRPVEVVKLVPRRGIMQCKLDAQLDKKDRLMKAITDEDYQNYNQDQPEQWRLRCEMALSMATLDKNGNYKKSPLMLAAEQEWVQTCQAAAAVGLPPLPYPANCKIELPVLADEIGLPPCSFPVPGFVEPPVSEDDSDDSSSSDDDTAAMPKKRKVMSKRDRERAESVIKNAKAKRSFVVGDDSSSEQLSTSEEESEGESESSSSKPASSSSECSTLQERALVETDDESEEEEFSGHFGDILED